MNYDLEGAQIRAARALLAWDLRELSARSGISVSTLQKFETVGLSGRLTTVRALLKAFDAAGVQFPGRGVALKNPESGAAA